MNYALRNRTIIVFLLFIAGYAVIAYKLFSIQVRHAGFYQQLAQQQYFTTLIKYPPRGEIYDRTGSLVALNKETTSAFITPSHIEHKEELGQFLKAQYPKVYARWQEHPNTHFLYVKRRLTPPELASIEKLKLKDLHLVKEPGRYYPNPRLGLIIGMTDIDNAGISGIEQIAQQDLAGTPTLCMVEKDARSGHYYFKRTVQKEGTTPQSITLAIDSTLQFLAAEELKDHMAHVGSIEGAVLIMNANTGEILTMTQAPDFDPNDQNLDITHTKNRIICDAHELGSVIKVFLACAALEEGVVTPDEYIDCDGRKETVLNGIRFTTWKAHGLIPFTEVIRGSNNIGVAKVALRVGTKLYNYYVDLGFGKKIGIFPGEAKGFINPPAHWSKQSIISLSFGYELSSSLLQLAQAFSIFAHEGSLIKPQLYKLHQSDEIIISKPVFKKETIDTMRMILAKDPIAGAQVYGKTGTARMLTNGLYDETKIIYTFVGLVEKENYRRIIVTFLRQSTVRNAYASTVAYPLFEHIVKKMLMHDHMIF